MSNCPDLLDANKPLRELGIYTTVLYPKYPKKQLLNILGMALDNTAGLSWFCYVSLLKTANLHPPLNFFFPWWYVP